MTSSDFLSDFPAHFQESIPLFTAEGCLPPGDFQPLRVEFERRFVETGNRERRASIYLGWNTHRHDLVQAGVPEAARQRELYDCQRVSGRYGHCYRGSALP